MFDAGGNGEAGCGDVEAGCGECGGFCRVGVGVGVRG